MASRDGRDLPSGWPIGARAEISCFRQICLNLLKDDRERTNDRRYESNDSREILNGSSALNTLLGCDELLEPLDLLDQKVLPRSGGEG